MSTQLKVLPFYCQTTRSSSIKLEVSYPNIPNLAYNFEMKLQVSIQKLLPRIKYQLMHQQTFLIPKKQVIIRHLQPSKMYQVVVSWSKKGLPGSQNINEQKTVFAFSEKMPQQEQDDQTEGVQDEAYGEFVKENIKGYFQQYYHNQQASSAISQNSNQASNIKNSSIASNQQRINSSRSKKNKPKPNDKMPLCSSQSLIKSIGQTDPFINKKNLQRYIIQGRKSTSLKDYLTTKDLQCFDSFNKVYKNEEQRRKHVQKTLLVSKAMNVFSEIYEVQREYGGMESESSENNVREKVKGKEFFRNDWFMGPFYSYDANQKDMKKKTRKNDEQINEA